MTDNSQPVARPTEPMDAETLEALRGSIQKWEKIVAGTGSNGGAYNCPLCLKFNTALNGGTKCRCFGCPVFAATGQHGCNGSPYERYEELEDDGDLNEEEMQEVAEEELAFLKSLLPPKDYEPPEPDGESFRGGEAAGALAEEQARIQRELKR